MLVQAVLAPKGGLPLVAFSNPDEIKARLEVHLGEDLGSLEAVLKFLNERNRTPDWDSNPVKGPVIHHGTERVSRIRFGNKHKGRGTRSRGLPDFSRGNHLVEPILEGLQLLGTHRVQRSPCRGGTLF